MPGLEFLVPGVRAHCKYNPLEERKKKKKTPEKRERTTIHVILGEAGHNSAVRQ